MFLYIDNAEQFDPLTSCKCCFTSFFLSLSLSLSFQKKLFPFEYPLGGGGGSNVVNLFFFFCSFHTSFFFFLFFFFLSNRGNTMLGRMGMQCGDISQLFVVVFSLFPPHSAMHHSQ